MDRKQFLTSAIKARGLTLAQASLGIKRSRTYLHQYVTYGEPTRLYESDREKLEDLLGMPRDSLRTLDEKPPAKGGKRIADSTTIRSNDTPDKIAYEGVESNVDLGRSIIPKERLFPNPKKDLPVYASAACGEAFVIVTSDPVEWIERPAILMGVPGAFAVYLNGDSMAPRYEHGEILYVHPRPPSRGKDALIIISEDNNEFKVMVKRYIEIRDSKAIFEQYNPKMNIDIDLKSIQKMYSIIGVYRT